MNTEIELKKIYHVYEISSAPQTKLRKGKNLSALQTKFENREG